jgi:tryptophan-rich sensory protein
MHKTTSAALAGIAVLAAGATGAQNGPQKPMTAAWYALLRKPAYTPPGPVIGAAWGVLEVLLAAIGFRLLRARRGVARDVALGGWAATLIGLAGYPWLFFGRKRLGASTLASGAMLASAATLAGAAREADPPSAAMTVPLLVWLGFATFLGEELWRRNKALSRG